MVKEMKNKGQSFNDKMVKRTVLPTIYLWLLAAGAVVAMGIWKPDVVLMNLDGFIALLAIISGVAVPALGTVLRMWESEQTQEVDNIPTELKHERERDSATKEHIIELEKIAQKHEHLLAQMAQEHSQDMDKIRSQLSIKTLEPKKK
tara:strand:+ start:202 stop:642 length:441 start_codon:yes stop_codon:yes gene_type:complete